MIMRNMFFMSYEQIFSLYKGMWDWLATTVDTFALDDTMYFAKLPYFGQL